MMSAMFNSIVVDPFVFYAVITGVLLAMGIIVFLLMKSKQSKQDYITLEPITIEDKPLEKVTSILDIKTEEVMPTIDIVDVKPEINNIINSIEKDLINDKRTVVANFETDQEQEAIISYQELLKKKDVLTANNKYDDELVETIEIEEPIKLDPISPKTEEAVKKFKNSEFISPIFGRVDNEVEYSSPKLNFTEIDREFEKVVNVKPLNTEIKKNEDFLNSLKDFRRNLE
jgi:hypothetical protein